jgi:hypothetical protein
VPANHVVKGDDVRATTWTIPTPVGIDFCSHGSTSAPPTTIDLSCPPPQSMSSTSPSPLTLQLGNFGKRLFYLSNQFISSRLVWHASVGPLAETPKLVSCIGCRILSQITRCRPSLHPILDLFPCDQIPDNFPGEIFIRLGPSEGRDGTAMESNGSETQLGEFKMCHGYAPKSACILFPKSP